MPLFKSSAVLHHIDWLVVRFVRYFDIFNSLACPRQTHTITHCCAAEIVNSSTHITDYVYTTSYVHSGICLRVSFRLGAVSCWIDLWFIISSFIWQCAAFIPTNHTIHLYVRIVKKVTRFQWLKHVLVLFYEYQSCVIGIIIWFWRCPEKKMRLRFPTNYFYIPLHLFVVSAKSHFS